MAAAQPPDGRAMAIQALLVEYSSLRDEGRDMARARRRVVLVACALVILVPLPATLPLGVDMIGLLLLLAPWLTLALVLAFRAYGQRLALLTSYITDYLSPRVNELITQMTPESMEAWPVLYWGTYMRAGGNGIPRDEATAAGEIILLILPSLEAILVYADLAALGQAATTPFLLVLASIDLLLIIASLLLLTGLPHRAPPQRSTTASDEWTAP